MLGRKIWCEQSQWFWDDAEDHGGFDRISPQGPFYSMDSARADAIARFPFPIEFKDGKPEHY